ncbi:methionyl-tRNA formyltransferase [Conexibacter arvalis]|uniref:UDP-4-amino-4-deoxy-L-arabinose formyltransferase/UDP-glucuronic acid dehydrogenase (UDP-4-keto-hexauronic acid decarboxylating) n=1 Tax=Conexibacter arvalis TaxID=912552 RepID=A0A840I9Z1_9ACTN|nr:formyltransferase family protein [Conexibacter arvalis]MBB4661666.1 UDP-4-amino-4-deoxy-L-arabinose formyltransferase/UDP-glucuronic acid dehydrogenase (UDP-4-keto-hexauronic acid decarboxylating) [Conexibacter arvalis]
MIVLIVAEEAAGVQALRCVGGRDDVRIAAVLTSQDDRRGASVAGAAARLGLPLRDPRLVRSPDFAGWIEEAGVDLLLNVHSLEIADAAVAAAPRIGSFNLHPGPLPELAGLNAPSWAICAGRDRHAVTLHWMMAGVDTGPIAYEAWFDVAPSDTGLRVSANCVRHGIPLLERLLADARRGADAIPAREQDLARRRWHGREAPYEGRVPWGLPARAVVDFVRASDYAPFPSPWGRPRATLDGVELEVVGAARSGERADAPPGTIGAARDDGVPVAAADEWVLVQRLRRDGERAAPAEALPAGRRFAVEDHRSVDRTSEEVGLP